MLDVNNAHIGQFLRTAGKIEERLTAGVLSAKISDKTMFSYRLSLFPLSVKDLRKGKVIILTVFVCNSIYSPQKRITFSLKPFVLTSCLLALSICVTNLSELYLLKSVKEMAFLKQKNSG